MKRPHTAACQTVLLLMVLLLVTPQPVKAEKDDPTYPVWAYTISNIKDTVCIGRKEDVRLIYGYKYHPPPPGVLPRPVPLLYDIDGHISATRGTVTGVSKEDDNDFRDNGIIPGAQYIRKFTYTATQEGKEEIRIKVELTPYEFIAKISFNVITCKASLQFNQSTNLSDGPVSVINNYFGNGSLRADENGQVSGSGSQAIWGDIPPYSVEGVTCTHTPPWEGSSGITFTGQAGEDGDIDVVMEMESLSVNTSTLTCTGEGSGGTTFPGYTFSSCQVPLVGFNFEAATLNIPFDCPGEAPYIVPITIIPRSES